MIVCNKPAACTKPKQRVTEPMGKKKIMHAYGPKSIPIAQGLVEDINVKHAYGPSSVPIAQGLVYEINAPHAFGLRESKRTYGSVSIPIAEGLVEIINAKDTKMVMSPKAQGLVSNTHHSKTCIIKNCTHDRMSGGKGAKRTNSGSVGKKTTFSDETNHAAVSLLPKKTDDNRWFSTLAPLTLLEVARKYVAKLNENRMLYNVSDATKAQIKGYYLTQIKGQTLDILWVFSSVENFYHRNFVDTVHGRNPAT